MTKTATTTGSLKIGDWYQVHSAGSIQKLAARETYRDPYTEEPAIRLTDEHGNVWQGPSSHFAARVTV